MTGWAINLLAAGLILIAGLALGRQVIDWLRSGTQPIGMTDHVDQVVGRDPSGELLATAWLEFGESSLAVRRSVINGNVDAVLAELRRGCREAAQADYPMPHQPGPAEQALLQRIAAQSPIDQLPGKWSMHQVASPVPLVVTVKQGTPADSSPQVAGTLRRVISWGLALPARSTGQVGQGQDEWTLFVCAENLPVASTRGEDQPSPPPSGRRSIAFRSDDGGVLCGWSGPGEPEVWKGSLDQWHDTQGWKPISGWNQLPDTWHRRYEHSSAGAADVQFSRTPDGLLRGFWMRTPRK